MDCKLIGKSLQLLLKAHLLFARSIFVTFGNKRYASRAVLSKEIRDSVVGSISSVSKVCVRLARRRNRGKNFDGESDIEKD